MAPYRLQLRCRDVSGLGQVDVDAMIGEDPVLVPATKKGQRDAHTRTHMGLTPDKLGAGAANGTRRDLAQRLRLGDQRA